MRFTIKREREREREREILYLSQDLNCTGECTVSIVTSHRLKKNIDIKEKNLLPINYG